EDMVEEAINSLPERVSDIMYLKYVYGYSNKEISKLLNIKEGTVRQNIARGKERLRKILNENGVEV
ncbi:sigma-70 region 4 domain-containing protein, partial [Peptostreptococcaceae bacterium OttesenSCG-928-C18]|nr:sigma-70 region 4 domain-containing protein [Peptostreptococcaceae bacterium OttesenSCG-928-C18]